jgi:hypothetical protein
VGINSPFSGTSTALSFPFPDEADSTRIGLVGEWEDWDWRDGTDDIDVDGPIGWDILDFDGSRGMLEAKLSFLA